MTALPFQQRIYIIPRKPVTVLLSSFRLSCDVHFPFSLSHSEQLQELYIFPSRLRDGTYTYTSDGLAALPLQTVIRRQCGDSEADFLARFIPLVRVKMRLFKADVVGFIIWRVCLPKESDS